MSEKSCYSEVSLLGIDDIEEEEWRFILYEV